MSELGPAFGDAAGEVMQALNDATIDSRDLDALAGAVEDAIGEAPPVDAEFVRANAARLRDDPDFNVSTNWRDPRYEDPTTSGLPPFNPARFLPQRHVMVGLSYTF